MEVTYTHEVETPELDDAKAELRDFPEVVHDDDEKLDEDQINEFLDNLEYVINNARDTDLVEKAIKVRSKIKDEGRAKENIIIKKWQCKKCHDIFETKREFNGHFYGKPDCNGEPRWMTEFDEPEDQRQQVRL